MNYIVSYKFFLSALCYIVEHVNAFTLKSKIKFVSYWTHDFWDIMYI